MTINRRSLLTASLGALLPMPAASALAQSSSLNVAWIRQLAVAAVVQKQVEFAKADGLGINLVNFNRGLDGMVAIQKGDVQASNCLVGYAQFFLALAQGIDLTVVAGACSRLNEILISTNLAPKDRIDDKNKAYVGENGWEVLRGKKVGTARGSYQEFILRSYLQAHGMSVDKDIVYVDLKTNADQVLALKQGGVDAIVSVEPSAAQARIEGYAILLSNGYDAGEFVTLNNLLMVRSDLIKSSPDTVRKLVRAHVKAIDFYRGNRSQWVTDTANVALFDKNTLSHLFEPEKLGLDPKYWANVEIDWRLPLQTTKQLAKNLQDVGFVQKDIIADIEPHFNYTFLEEATGKRRVEIGG